MFTSLEIIALIFIALALIKMLFLAVKPKAWISFSKKIYSSPKVVSFVSTILALVVLYYLILNGITAVEVLAVSAFVGLIVMVGLAPEFPYLIKKYEAVVKKGRLWKEYWLYVLLWLALIILGLLQIFR
ncbi:MAG: hypothetical protein Q8P81_01435 [Nanoarchaeota archaeon]|nr:hypothetical protein [Nanoarchaeota archaeon]